MSLSFISLARNTVVTVKVRNELELSLMLMTFAPFWPSDKAGAK